MLRFYVMLGAAVAMGPVYAALLGSVSPVADAVGISLGVLATTLLWLKWRESRVTRTLLTLSLAFCMPIYYASTGRVIHGLGFSRQDEALIHADSILLSWLMPRGQISLWLDQNSWMGPHTVVGKTLTELFQAFYLSYYFWGYGLIAYLLVQIWKNQKTPRGAELWSGLQQLMTAWLGAYIINFFCYILLPAIGPRYFYPELYVNPVDGWGFAKIVQEFILANQATSEDCFPSGHTSLSWVTAICALRFAPRYGRFATGAAMMITMATLYLRYHYFVDVLGALPLILGSLAWGGFLFPAKYQALTAESVTVLKETVTQ